MAELVDAQFAPIEILFDRPANSKNSHQHGFQKTAMQNTMQVAFEFTHFYNKKRAALIYNYLIFIHLDRAPRTGIEAALPCDN